MALVAGLFLLGVLFFFLNRRVERHLQRYEHLDGDGIRQSLTMLMEQGSAGAFVIFEDSASAKFVQFSLKATEERATALQSDFPYAPWSESDYERVRQHADRFGAVSEQPGGGAVAKFLHVDFALDVASASRFATAVFIDVFGCARVDVRARSSGLTRRPGRLPPPLTRATAWGQALGRAVGESWRYVRTAAGWR